MRKFTLILILAIGALGLQAQQAAPAEDPLAIDAQHDFGTIRQGRPVTYDFQFTNTGKTPLTIQHVQASCGCTTPKWSSDPVPPGRTAVITVGYNASAEGNFEKSVTIAYNGNLTKTIFIKGKVDKPQPSAPANSSVTLLKQIK